MAIQSIIVLSALFVVSLPNIAHGMDNLRVAYQWTQLDFDFPNEGVMLSALLNQTYTPENNLPLGLEVYGDRLFVTVPRWKSGVAASLTYINLTETANEQSPKLKPYPNWAAHNLDESPEIISPFRVRADQCGRLWVVDSGEVDLLGNMSIRSPITLLVYDLKTDTLLRKYPIPMDQLHNTSFVANIAVEDEDCDNTYAYLGDLGRSALIVYSWQMNDSWAIVHKYFAYDTLASAYNISGISFNWTDGLFGLALSKPDDEGYPTLYFHPMSSTEEYSVNTKYLRDPAITKVNDDKFIKLGSRGPKSQSGVSFYDKKTDVLFYTLLNLNAVACWRTTSAAYTMESQGRVYMSNITMVFPNDIKVDANDNLWVLSDRLPKFMYGSLNPNEVNFRILTAHVPDAIRGTACDSKLVVKTTNKPSMQTSNTTETAGSSHLAATNLVFTTIIAIITKYFL